MSIPTVDDVDIEHAARRAFEVSAANLPLKVFPWESQDERDREIWRKAVIAAFDAIGIGKI